MKSIKVTEDVKELMSEVRKKVAVDSNGEITEINRALEYVLVKYLKENK